MRACITALCPTYGRFELLRDAVACFLLQTYRPRRLLILNDAPEPLRLTERGNTLRLPGCIIEVWNADSRYETLGHKRQALLTAAWGSLRSVEGGKLEGYRPTSGPNPFGATGALAAHWDDDDWYLPWHLRQCVEALEDSGADCVKPRGAWWLRGPRDDFSARGPCHNVFEGQMAFDRRSAIDLGGYSREDSGQAKHLLNAFKAANAFERFEPELISYCYRWGHDGAHVSAVQGEGWAESNNDFGGVEPLIPADAAPIRWAMNRMQPPLQRLLDTLRGDVSTDRHSRLKEALNAAYSRLDEDGRPASSRDPDV